MTKLGSINQCVDHDHDTGVIRGVLCRTCNGIEGKIRLLAIRAAFKEGFVDFIIRLGEYLKLHRNPQTKYIHPTFLTEPEKKAKRLKKQRADYAKKKAAK